MIFRIGTDGFIIPAGRTTEPDPDIITVSPAAAETAAACCPWPGGGCRSESDSEPGIVTGLPLVISSQSGSFSGAVTLYLCNILNHCSGASRKKNEINTREKKQKKQNTKKEITLFQWNPLWGVLVSRSCVKSVPGSLPSWQTCDEHTKLCVIVPLSGCALFSGCAAVTAMLPPPTCRLAHYACVVWDTGDVSLRRVLRGVGWNSQDRLASITLDRHLM